MADDDTQDKGGQEDTSGGSDVQDQQRDDATRTETDQQPDDAQDKGGQDTGKTFTQADVDRLLADRLARERKKFAEIGRAHV